jgi:glycosyltransferase involved in cell wall biosynthesis
MAAPLVSIPILCHNYGRFLAEAIESALAQTYRTVEVTVVDDGSTDGSAEIARRYHPDVEVVSHENLGVVRACNAAVARARGELFAFLSADDTFEPTYIEELVDALGRSPHASFAYCDARLFGAESGVRRAFPFSPAILATVGNFVNGSALTRRDAYLAVGGYHDDLAGYGYEDWDLWLRMLEHGHRGTYVAKPLLNWRRHPDGSRNPTRGARVADGRRLIRERHAALAERFGRSPEPLLVGAVATLRSPRVNRLAEQASWRRFSARRAGGRRRR